MQSRVDTIQASRTRKHNQAAFSTHSFAQMLVSRFDYEFDDVVSVPKHQSVMHDIEEVRGVADDSSQTPFEIITFCTSSIEASRPAHSRILRLFPGHRIGWVGRIPGTAPFGQERGITILEHFRLFARFPALRILPWEIAPVRSKLANKTCPNRINDTAGWNDSDGRCGSLGRRGFLAW